MEAVEGMAEVVLLVGLWLDDKVVRKSYMKEDGKSVRGRRKFVFSLFFAFQKFLRDTETRHAKFFGDS